MGEPQHAPRYTECRAAADAIRALPRISTAALRGAIRRTRPGRCAAPSHGRAGQRRSSDLAGGQRACPIYEYWRLAAAREPQRLGDIDPAVVHACEQRAARTIGVRATSRGARAKT